MEARCQVKITEYENEPSVYLYSHWGADSIEDDVKDALKRRWRWSDYEYLTRIIYDVMVGDESGTETGYGISTSEHGDIEKLVEILPGQKVRIGKQEWTFEEYINQ
jgi:hypothetical protein